MARLKEFDPEERLEKAKELFWEKGYNATSMKDLVTVMKLNPGSIYSTFGGKRPLFLRCLKKYADEKLVAFQQGARLPGSPLVVLECLLRKGADTLLEEGKGCMVTKTTFELGEKDKKAYAISASQAKDIIAVFEMLLLEAQEAGEIPADKVPKDLAYFIYVGYNGLRQMEILFKDKKAIDIVLGQLISSLRS